MHSCCTIILSTGDPRGLRKEFELEEVTDYPHLEGALYRHVMFENRFISCATYIVVLNKLPVCVKNAHLLLLTTGQKQLEFCRWLLSDECDLTEEEKHEYQSYLVNQNLIENEEVDKLMRYRLFGPPRVDWIFEGVAEKPKDYQEEFYQTAVKKAVESDSNNVVLETLVSASSPLEVAQKALGAKSPIELALKSIKTKEQLDEFLARIQQTELQDAPTPAIDSQEEEKP